MLTQCGRCGTVFRLGVEELRRGRGFVRCGRCGTVFAALERLAEDEAAAVAVESTAGADSATADEAEFAATLSADEHAILFTEPGEDQSAPEPAADSAETDDIPAEIRDEVIAMSGGGRRVRRRLGWLMLCAVLLLALALQSTWQFRDELVARYPVTAPLVDRLCAYVPCSVGAARAVNAIELATRDVRDHPRYRDALLVNATMINQAPLPQPYPVLELSLYSRNGAVLGVRRFAPGEYLDESIDPAAGMPPERLVFVVLELSTPADDAVSFEFSFL